MDKEELQLKLLDLMRAQSYTPKTLIDLATDLGLSRREMPVIKKMLENLLRDGVIAKVKGDRYGVSADLDLISGTVDFRQSGWAFLRCADNKSIIEIRPEDTGVALNGDKVLARMLFERPKKFDSPRFSRQSKKSKDKKAKNNYQDEFAQKKYAKIIRILERKNKKVIGTLQRSYNFWHVVPDDPRFFYDVIVGNPEQCNAFPKPKENDKVVVQLNEWKQRHINPTGEIVENLGISHTPMAEYRAILQKYDLEETFPADVLAEVERIPQDVTQKEIEGRRDCRGDFTITIDPQDAKDFDDAISLKMIPNKGWEVGVHIADVSNYVKPNSPLDREACKRGNSTYLVGTVIPMLPFELSNGICSLVEDKDRLVKSVFLTYDSTGNCVNVDFANSVIKSVKRLSYEQAYAFLKEDDLEKIITINPPPDYETAFTGKRLNELPKRELLDLRTLLRRLWSIAATLRKKRMRKGSLDLEVPEFKILCDKDGYADRVEKVENNEAHQLIEEFMLAANEAVSRELYAHKIPHISRVHDSPDPEKLNELREELLTFGIECADMTSRKELIRILAIISKHQQSYLLKTKFLRSLKRAEYRAETDGHFGLCKDFYAHFTSPIRRYADLTVHRNINYMMKSSNMPTAPKGNVVIPNKAALAQTAAHISRTEQNSTEAERDSRKVKLMEFFDRSINTGASFEAVITSISNHGFFIELTQSMAFGFIHVHTLRDDIYRANTEGTQMHGRKTGKTFKIGDKIWVEVEAVDRFKRQIDFHLANSQQENPSTKSLTKNPAKAPVKAPSKAPKSEQKKKKNKRNRKQ